jgi:cation diffusion facilitator family transporter
LKRGELSKGGTVAAKSFGVLVSVGVLEVLVGLISGSVALVADGIHSFADATVSFVVWLGLRLTRRAPDGKFHFGYYRAETLSSIIAALIMFAFGFLILYESYLSLLSPKKLMFVESALITSFLATTVALYLALYKIEAARKLDSLALKTDAFSSVKDVLTSMIAFIGIALSHYFGIMQTDAIAGIIIAVFIFTVSYVIIKEASLVLMDACTCPEIVSEIEKIAMETPKVRKVYGVRLRKLGPYIVGDMHVELDGDTSIYEADKIVTEIEQTIKKEFDEVTEFKIRIKPFKEKNA